MTNLDRLEKLARAATPGKWECDGDYVHITDPDGGFCAIPCEPQDARYIAAFSPDVALELIARIRRLELDLAECFP